MGKGIRLAGAPDAAPSSTKKLSSRLMDMKFMQRFQKPPKDHNEPDKPEPREESTPKPVVQSDPSAWGTTTKSVVQSDPSAWGTTTTTKKPSQPNMEQLGFSSIYSYDTANVQGHTCWKDGRARNVAEPKEPEDDKKRKRDSQEQPRKRTSLGR